MQNPGVLTARNNFNQSCCSLFFYFLLTATIHSKIFYDWRVLLKFLLRITVMNLDLSADVTYSSSVKSEIVVKDEKILEKKKQNKTTKKLHLSTRVLLSCDMNKCSIKMWASSSGLRAPCFKRFGALAIHGASCCLSVYLPFICLHHNWWFSQIDCNSTKDSHNTANFAHYSFRLVCGFFNVPHWTFLNMEGIVRRDLWFIVLTRENLKV